MAIKTDRDFGWPTVRELAEKFSRIDAEQKRLAPNINRSYVAHSNVFAEVGPHGEAIYKNATNGRTLMKEEFSGRFFDPFVDRWSRSDVPLTPDMVVDNVIKIGKEEELCLCSKALWS